MKTKMYGKVLSRPKLRGAKVVLETKKKNQNRAEGGGGGG